MLRKVSTRFIYYIIVKGLNRCTVLSRALQVYFSSGQNVLDISFLRQDWVSIVKFFQLKSCSGYGIQVRSGVWSELWSWIIAFLEDRKQSVKLVSLSGEITRQGSHKG